MKEIDANDTRTEKNQPLSEVLVGRRLRELRTQRGFSLRSLAERSGLNINTLSLVENGKTSPSVSTLQQLALALNVPITAFFESDPQQKNIVFTRADLRPRESFGSAQIHNLGKNFKGSAVQPFIVTLQPGKGSGDHIIVHTGYEFVYCINGSIKYQIENQEFILESEDSLLFEAHLPHCWENTSDTSAKILLVLIPVDEREEPGGRHFSLEAMKKELIMKIAVITDDGKTISQHFGRAPYYMVCTIEEGKIVNREMRAKLGHNHFANQQHEEAHHADHGLDSISHNKHVSMAEAIADCKVLLCGGMGMGAYDSMRRLNIQPFVTDVENIDDAVKAFLDGKLIDHTELLH